MINESQRTDIVYILNAQINFFFRPLFVLSIVRYKFRYFPAKRLTLLAENKHSVRAFNSENAYLFFLRRATTSPTLFLTSFSVFYVSFLGVFFFLSICENSFL